MLVDKSLLLHVDSCDYNFCYDRSDYSCIEDDIHDKNRSRLNSEQNGTFVDTSVDNSNNSSCRRRTNADDTTTTTSSRDTFTGHFIYILGCTLYQEGGTECVLFHYLDPARPRYGDDGLLSTHTVSGAVLDRARCHPGTDEDIVFVRLK